ncbi:MAG: MFS transporter [Candidatus Aminicenantes bacterium]|nr:MAG: MFS transporter [Candidatus Aminicenantes bacterium]
MTADRKTDTKKTIRIFAAASFLNDLGSDIIYPIWPLFLTTVLKANMAALGFLDGLGDSLVSLSQAASGYISDRIKKRKAFIWTGYIFGALSRVGYALSSAWTHLIPFRVLDRSGKIRSAPRDAIVADISDDTNRGKNFGLIRAMDHLGAVFGILICIFLLSVLGYRILFALAALPSLISAALIFFLIKERRSERLRIYKGISLKDLDRNFTLFLVLSSILALGAFSYSFLLIYAKEFGFNVTFVPVLYLIFTVVASLLSYPFGKLSDRIGRKPVLLLSYLFWIIVCLSVISRPDRFMIVLVFIFYGAHKGALEPVQKTLVSELAPCKFRASCLGGFQMVTGLCALPASFIAGVLWEILGMSAPFYLSLILTTVSGGMLLFVKEH